MAYVLKMSFFLVTGVFFLFLLVSPVSVQAASFGVFLNTNPNPAVVAPGGEVTINWSVSWGATPKIPYNCSAPGLGSFTIDSDLGGGGGKAGTFGARTYNVSNSYTLTCVANDGEAVASNLATVTVSSIPVVTVSASPTNVPANGGSTIVSWTASQATSCTPTGGTPAWISLSGMQTGGALQFSVSTPTTFTLTCSNAAGVNVTASAIVTVGGVLPPPPPPDPANHCGNYKFEPDLEECDSIAGPTVLGPCPQACSSECKLNNCPTNNPSGYLISASGNMFRVGEAITLQWDVTKGGVPYQCNMVSNDPNWNDGDAAPASGSRTFIPTLNGVNAPGVYFYTLCSSVINTPFFQVQIFVSDPPVIEKFIADPNPIDVVGQPSTLQWTVKNADKGCVLFKTATTNPPGETLWSGNAETTTEKVVSPVTTTDYILYCTKTPVSVQETMYGLNIAKKTIRLTVTGTPDPSDPSTPPGPPGPGDTETPPTTSLTCGQGACQQKNCDPGYNPTQESCNSGTGSCCVAATVIPPTILTAPWSNPLDFNTVEGLLDKILSYLQGIIVILSLIMIVIGSIVYMTAGGNDSKLSTGKLIITASLIGLALALAAPSFLKQIGDILGWSNDQVNQTSVQSSKTLLEILETALNFLLSIVGIIAIIMLVVGGMMYMLAAGDEKRMETGKTIVTYSLIGIAVSLAALVIVGQVVGFFV